MSVSVDPALAHQLVEEDPSGHVQQLRVRALVHFVQANLTYKKHCHLG